MLDIFFIIIGFILLIKGADFLVEGASNIAKRFHIPEIVIGLTIVAIGTSMPELVVSVTSALEGHSDIAIGNVVGSNIANMFLILGVCSVIKPLEFKKQTRLIENPITVLEKVPLIYDPDLSRPKPANFKGYIHYSSMDKRSRYMMGNEGLMQSDNPNACHHIQEHLYGDREDTDDNL